MLSFLGETMMRKSVLQFVLASLYFSTASVGRDTFPGKTYRNHTFLGFKASVNIIYGIAVVVREAQGTPGGDRGLPCFFCFEDFLKHSSESSPAHPPRAWYKASRR